MTTIGIVSKREGGDATHASAASAAADDAELLRLLLACLRQLGLTAQHQPRLLLGHHGVLSALLDQVPAQQRTAARKALTQEPTS